MYGQEQLQSTTVEELKVIARDLGITGYSAFLKDDLVQAILTAQASRDLPNQAVISLPTELVGIETPFNENIAPVVPDKFGIVAPTLTATPKQQQQREMLQAAMAAKIYAMNHATPYDLF